MSIEAEIAAQFAGAIEVEHAVQKFAEQIRDEIKDRTPVFDAEKDRRATPGIGEPGDLKDSIKVEHPPRVTAVPTRRVISRDPKAIWAELGTRHFPEVGMFAQVAHLHGGTGPVIDAGVAHAQGHLRRELETLAKLRAGHAGTMRDAVTKSRSIAEQKRAVDQARLNRSAAFKAARGGRRGRSR